MSKIEAEVEEHQPAFIEALSNLDGKAPLDTQLFAGAM
jgi:hypothetical protein